MNHLLYLVNDYMPSKRNIATGVVSVILLVALACTSPAPAAAPSSPSESSAPIEQTYTLHGTVYHDYNGDGKKDDNEPAIPGVEVDLISNVWPPRSVRDAYPWEYNASTRTYVIQLKTDANGDYSIQIPKGEYELGVDSNNIIGCNNQSFRYINISPAEFKRITDSLDIELKSDLTYDIALMQGFLTLPFGPKTKFLGKNQFGIESYVDMDNRDGYVMNWKGNTGQTYDRHTGTDYYMEENTPILAAAPGVVIADFLLEPIRGLDVLIQHESPYCEFKNISTEYGHLKKVNVKVGDVVKRGDVIGLSGRIMAQSNEFYNGEHLHFTVFLLNSWASVPYSVDGFYTDPYRNIAKDIQTISFWTKDNDPQYP